MIDIKLQHHGSDTAVVLEGDNRQEIIERFWSFWNHGATNGELEWQYSPNKILPDCKSAKRHHLNHEKRYRATFWARGDNKLLGRDKILRAMENAMLFKLLNDAGDIAWKGVKGGAMPTAKKIAKEWYDTLEPLIGENRAIKINSLGEVYQEPFEAAPTTGFRFLQKQEHGVADADAEGRFAGAKSSLGK